METRTIIEKIIFLLKQSKKDDFYKTMACSTFSFGVTVWFALYNGFLGVYVSSVWHGGICVFYCLLASVRGIVLFAEKDTRTECERKKEQIRKKAFFLSVTVLLFLNLTLIWPIALMAKFEKPVNLSLIPAIAMAAYTAYKVTIASIHLCKKTIRKHPNILVAELRTVNFIDALVSVLTLQNTLIMVNRTGESDDKMFVLVAVSSAAIYIIIIFTTIRLLAMGAIQYRNQSADSSEKRENNCMKRTK